MQTLPCPYGKSSKKRICLCLHLLRTTGQMKTLQDHLCVRWMVHRPKEELFSKRVAILANAVEPLNIGAQKDIATSLRWLDISDIRNMGMRLMEGTFFHELSEKRRTPTIHNTKKQAQRYHKMRKDRKASAVSVLFTITKMIHQTFAQ